jgi:hypothetical protein
MAGFLPPGFMLVFSLLTFRNLKLRQRRRQIQPLPIVTLMTIETRRQQAKDQQVLAMLLIQVFVYVSSTTLYTINLLYTVLTMKDAASKSSERKSIEAFASFIAGVLVFVCPCLSFYSFTLISRLFRKELRSMALYACGRQRHWPCMMNNNTTGNTSLTRRAPTLEIMQRQIALPLPPVVVN